MLDSIDSYLCNRLQLAFDNDKRSTTMMEKLNSIRKALVKINRVAGTDLRQDEEVKEAMADIHLNPIELWIKLVKVFRQHPLGR